MHRFDRLAAALLLAAAPFAAACAAADPAQEPADLVLRNGRVVTLSDSVAEGTAIAMRGAYVVAVGSDEEIGAYIGDSTEVVDLAGRLAIPGFIEGHGHFLSLGRSKMILDLTTATDWDDIVTMVGAAAVEAAAGTWIVGRGWHQEKWTSVPEGAVDGVPTHESLSAVTPDHPVYLTHASGHASFANAKALELAGVTGSTPDPSGGEIVHDAQGRPTGLLRETAQRLVGRALSASDSTTTPEQREAELREQVRLAGEEALSKGITSFHDAGSGFGTIDFFKRLEAAGELPVRLYVMVRGESNAEMDERLPDYFMPIEGDDYLTVRSIKRQIDGALGPHGAWLLAPYEDLPESTGLNLEDPADIAGTAEVAVRHGFQVNTHAIGDRANREVLDIYQRVFEAHPDRTDLRWRIEHAQHLHPDDIQRFADLGVIAAMQGIHGTSDGPWVLRRLGEERARTGAYVWRDLIDAGVLIANGTDVPVEDIDPIVSYHASVTRLMSDGQPFYPEQRMTREEGLRSYTVWNAYAAFEEQLKGTLAPGMLADVTVLSRDILTVPDDEILSAEVDLTIVGGEIRYRREGGAVAGR